jgi:hypothetical protein
VLLVGPHHEAETRARERLLELPAKTLVPHGYGRLDALLALAAAAPAPPPGDRPLALVAPSWGDAALLETCGLSLVASLLEEGFAVTVRPHPMTRKRNAAVVAALAARFAGAPGFSIETDVATTATLLAADLLVSDWSGAALEYAFARERPVLYVDVPRKVNDPAYEGLGLEPIEVRLRERIGDVVAAGDGEATARAARRLLACAGSYRSAIREARAEAVYNLGCSGQAAAAYLADAADAADRGRAR